MRVTYQAVLELGADAALDDVVKVVHDAFECHAVREVGHGFRAADRLDGDVDVTAGKGLSGARLTVLHARLPEEVRLVGLA